MHGALSVQSLYGLDAACGKPARRRYYMYHAGNLRDSATVWVQSSGASAHCIHIHTFNKVGVRKIYECQNYEKNHRLMRMRTRT